jgi:hypothetical protein
MPILLWRERRKFYKRQESYRQIEAAHKYATIKQEIVDWGIPNDPTLANMYLAQGHLDKQIEVKGELTEAERERAIMDATSLKLGIAFIKKELSLLNKILIRSRRPSYHNGIQQPEWKSLELREK